jgi:Na+/H+ antiporter NhaD/arsenite permease-like protein
MTILLIIFGLTYLLIATEIVDKSIAAILGAALVIGLHYTPYENALHHIDLNVIFLLVGMMLIVNVLSKTGFLEWLAMITAKKARGNGMLIVLQLFIITAVFSSFLDNVTTVILVAPITILITQILEIPTIPILVMEGVFSNIGGTATLVGDPPNVIIGSRAHLSFNDFLVNLGPVIVIIMVLMLLIVYFRMKSKTVASKSARKRIAKAHPHLAIVDKRNLRISLVIFGFVLLGFFLGRVLNIEPGIVALSGGVLMAWACGMEIHHLLERVEWATILFFIGLFMLIGTLQDNGVFMVVGEQLIAWTQGNLLLTVMCVLWASAILSAIVDNIPLVIAMIPLIQTIIPAFASQMGIEGNPAMIQTAIKEPLYWSLALGACLGGNGSLVGASANVVIAQIAKKNNYPLTFWCFTRTSAPIMLFSLLICTVYLYLRYFI